MPYQVRAWCVESPSTVLVRIQFSDDLVACKALVVMHGFCKPGNRVQVLVWAPARVVEWLGTGLQSLSRQFDSDRWLQQTK